MPIEPNRVRPRSGNLRTAEIYSGMSRSSLYELAAVYRGLFKKAGASTIVDFDVLDRVIDALPAAEIKPPRPRPPLDHEPTSPRRRPNLK
jgi:hypothetical protein